MSFSDNDDSVPHSLPVHNPRPSDPLIELAAGSAMRNSTYTQVHSQPQTSTHRRVQEPSTSDPITPALNTSQPPHEYTSSNHSPLRIPSPIQPLSPILPSLSPPTSTQPIPTQVLSSHRPSSSARSQQPHQGTITTSGDQSAAQAHTTSQASPLTGLHDWDPNIENRRLAQLFGWKQDPDRPFYDNAPDVTWEEIDPNAGKLETRWNGVFRKGRAYSFPLRRRHQGRRDSWSPVRGQKRGQITRDNFKMPRTGFVFPDLDSEWKINRKLWVSTLIFLSLFNIF